jgi:chromate transport protein ChrA
MLPYLSNILYLHSILRYFILALAIVVAFQSLLGMMRKQQFKKGNRLMALFLLIFCDLQLIFGIALYYYKLVNSGLMQSVNVMKDTYARFYAVEHSVSMIVAIVLVHVAYSIAKKNMDSDRKFKRMFWCSFIALALFLAMIPWEGKQVVGRPNIPTMQR